MSIYLAERSWRQGVLGCCNAATRGKSLGRGMRKPKNESAKKFLRAKSRPTGCESIESSCAIFERTRRSVWLRGRTRHRRQPTRRTGLGRCRGIPIPGGSGRGIRGNGQRKNRSASRARCFRNSRFLSAGKLALQAFHLTVASGKNDVGLDHLIVRVSRW